MAGVKALRKLQLGVETTSGTAADATAIWRGLGTLEDTREVVHVDEDIGYLSKIDRTYTPRYGAALTMEDTEATFEQLPYILAAGVENIITGVADGTTGSGKIYEYNFPTTAARTTKTYTIEGGDDQQAWEMEYAFVKSFKLSGVPGEAWKVSADWVGRQLTKCSFTALSLATVEDILFSKTKLYIDTAGGTMGLTQKTSTLLGATLNVDTGLREVYTGDGSLYFTFTKQVGPEVTLDVTFEHDATAVAEFDAWRAETPRQIRLLAEGSTLGTAGDAYSKKTLSISLVGKWEKFEKLGEIDGNDIVSGTLRARYDTTATKYCDIIVVNELAALT